MDADESTTRHLIIELPQPGSSSRPDKSTVLGQCGASMVRQGASGEGSLLQNGVSPRVWIRILRPHFTRGYPY